MGAGGQRTVGAEAPTWDDALARAAIEAISDLVLVKGPGSRLVWGNEPFRAIYGMTEEELAAAVLDAAHSDPDDTLQYVRDDHRVYSTGEVLDVGVEPITSVDGEVAYFHTIKSPIRDAAGDIIGTVGVSRPASDAEAAESASDRAARHTSLDSLRALVASLPTAVAMFDATQRLIAWSDAFNELLGEAPGAELFGRTQLDVVEAIVPIADGLRRVLRDGRPERRILEVGARRLSVEIRAWHTSDRRVGGTVVAMHDVTELVQVQDRLEAANDELVQFNYRASHDLIAPLSTVSGTLQLVSDMIADGDVDEVEMLLGMARGEIDRLRSLVADLIDLARSDASAVHVEPVALDEVLDGVVSASRDRLDEAGVEVIVDVDGERIHSVEIRIRQLLENLVANAAKFADPGEDRRTVSITSSRRRDTVRIDVSDNGLGVPDELIDDLFDLFVRGTSSSTMGHGLGLYIVKKHVDRLGGTVELTSSSKPTTFTVTLPNQRPDQAT